MGLPLIKQLLHQAVRANERSARYARGDLVEINTRANQVQRRVLPAVRHRIASAVKLNRPGGEQSPVAEFVENWQQPFLTRQGGGGVSVRQLHQHRAEGCPGAEQTIPRLVDGFVEFEIAREVI